ncbi:hypothetical protein ILYODFUR_030536 [Ilyodon furcidens]|uniref:Ig-like domain-containing protein n=1 Tax=Ilyodon furcidens TaxID=33524 RepID=A0ABV0TZE5_9TELE
MILLWLTLLLLHQGYTLVPVVTAELGEPVTLTCAFTDQYQGNAWLYWYKQSTGDTLKLIVMQWKLMNPTYGPEFSASRLIVTNSKEMSNLTILKTLQQDGGMYHCAQTDLSGSFCTGTYLSIKSEQGNSESTLSYRVVQQPTVSHHRHPADLVTLQCLMLSDSKNTTCSGDPNAFWFKTRSDKSSADVIYTEGKKAKSCDKSSDSHRCFYDFSKNVSSSDPGTYYCAVATCGQILFGNGTHIKHDKPFKISMLMVTVICLVISLIGNIVLICFQIQRSACQLKESSSSQTRSNFNQKREDVTEDGEDLNYAALHFSEGRASGGKKNRQLMTEESVYSPVKGTV